jgi:hypothetical protein
MKKLILILLSTAITSLQAQTDSELNQNTSIESPCYLKNQTDLVLTKAPKTIDTPLPSSASISDYNSQYYYADYISDFKRRE